MCVCAFVCRCLCASDTVYVCEHVCVIVQISRLCFCASLLSRVSEPARARHLSGVFAISTFCVSVRVYMCALVCVRSVACFCCEYGCAHVCVRSLAWARGGCSCLDHALIWSCSVAYLVCLSMEELCQSARPSVIK